MAASLKSPCTRLYLTWANWLFLAFFALNRINDLRAFNVAFSSIPTAPSNHPFPQQQLSDLSRRQKAAIRASRVGPMAQLSVPSRYTCVLPPARRGSKSSRKRHVKPSLSGLCTNLKNLRNKSCSWTAVDLNDHIERIFDVILDGLLWKRCPRKCRRRRAISPNSNRR